jgi:anti-sigma regulatory factor (Ser/Thr protein kinase)
MVVEAELPRSPNAAFQARALMAGFPCDLDQVQHGDAILALSELVANAYRHGRGRITVHLESVGGGLRAQVGDEGRSFDPRGSAGAGLRIVGAVSDAWGLNRGGTEVWFEIGPSGNHD